MSADNRGKNLEVIANDISYIKQDISEIKQSVVSTYVTKDQFEPVRNLVYGLVGVVGTILVTAGVSLLLNR